MNKQITKNKKISNPQEKIASLSPLVPQLSGDQREEKNKVQAKTKREETTFDQRNKKRQNAKKRRSS